MKMNDADSKKGKLTIKNLLPAMIMAALLLLLAACSPASSGSTVTNPDTQAQQQTQIARAVAQTQAALQQAAPPNEPTSTLASAPLVSVSLDTNCRTGPGEVYEIVGALMVGQSAEVVGRSHNSDNWIIKLPSNPNITCWLWGYYATVAGDTSNLPVVAAPATPTPAAAFSVTYLETRDCYPSCMCWGLAFRLVNTGTVTWRSYEMTIHDFTSGRTSEYFENSFTDSHVCAGVPIVLQDLEPGEAGVAVNYGMGTLDYDPAGHSLAVTFKLCSEKGLGGICATQSVNVTP